MIIEVSTFASLGASERYGIKNEWINDIRLLTCNNLFTTYYMLKKSQAMKLKYKKALIKLQSKSSRQSNSSRQIWRQASAKI